MPLPSMTSAPMKVISPLLSATTGSSTDLSTKAASALAGLHGVDRLIRPSEIQAEWPLWSQRNPLELWPCLRQRTEPAVALSSAPSRAMYALGSGGK